MTLGGCHLLPFFPVAVTGAFDVSGVDVRIEKKSTCAEGMKIRPWWCPRGDAWIRYARL